ncbi:MAG TPA: hypothetical protein GX521_00445 [Firmicutes bacterium]|nr:hypothetical protein [Bacillota bacterium]
MGQRAAHALSLKLLGPFRLDIYGNAVRVKDWKSKKALLLLKYFAARYGEKIPSDVLVDIFWQDADLDSAGHNLHGTVHLLRKTLKEHTACSKAEPGWIQYSNGLYWLEMQEDVYVDAEVFANLCAKSELLEAKKPRQALKACLDALELYQGEFLAEDLYAEWAQEYREHYHKLYVELVLRAGRLLLDHKSDPKKAFLICKSALRLEPYLEELHQMAIRCCISLERFPEAILHFDSYAKLLAEEFDLEPSGTTKALLEGIRARQLDAPPHGSAGLICSREGFQAVVHRLIEKRQPVTLLAITFAQPATREQLYGLLALLTKSLRKNDVVTQWSGQVVAVFLADSDAQTARRVQERIRANLNAELKDACRISSRVFTTDGTQSAGALLKAIIVKTG